MASRAAWEQAPIIVFPFLALSLPADQGGSPFMMELLVLTGALHLLAHLRTVYSDCQGLIRKLQQRNLLHRNTNSPGYPLLRDCQRLISSTRSIQWIKGHPERSKIPQSGWSQDQWGNYIADLHASLTPLPLLTYYPHSLSFRRYNTMSLPPQPSIKQTGTSSLTPNLLFSPAPSAPSTKVRYSTTSLSGTTPAPTGTPPPAGLAPRPPSHPMPGNYCGTVSPREAPRYVIYGTCGGTGKIMPIAAAGPAEHLAACPLCGHSACSLTHIICHCSGLTHERAGLHLDFRILTSQLARGPCRALGRAVMKLLFRHPGIQERGHLWTGLWTPEQRGLPAPYLRRCLFRDGQRTLLILCTRATESAQQLWTQSTRTLWELFCSHAPTSASPLTQVSYSPKDANPALPGDPTHMVWDSWSPSVHCPSTNTLRLREEGDYG